VYTFVDVKGKWGENRIWLDIKRGNTLKEGNKEGNNSCRDEKRTKRKMREKRENLRFEKKIEW
jgi:hypothetical protein